jgi:hypothetical protein
VAQIEKINLLTALATKSPSNGSIVNRMKVAAAAAASQLMDSDLSDQRSRGGGFANEHSQRRLPSKPSSNTSGRQGRYPNSPAVFVIVFPRIVDPTPLSGMLAFLADMKLYPYLVCDVDCSFVHDHSCSRALKTRFTKLWRQFWTAHRLFLWGRC